MSRIIAETNVERMLEQSGYDAFAVMERIDNLYGKGIITEHEAYAMIDVLVIYF